MAGLLDTIQEYNPFAMAKHAEDVASMQSDMTMFPGGQQDALRHALWNAQMAQKYGKTGAMMASMPWEAISVVKSLFDTPETRQRVIDESVMDWKNNYSGAEFGANNPNMSREELARQLRSHPLEAIPHYWGQKK